MQEITENAELPADVPASDWSGLRTGQTVTITEQGHPTSNGTIDAITPDASILWVRLPGPSPRRLFLCTDPVTIHPSHYEHLRRQPPGVQGSP
ncbi:MULTISPECIES: efflux RND transporter periplasmic adaptor subunit [unclassified Arthrobacter]|uniref:efflux RND transporter periplasmic adaptor subunit n=1 Tax=unclassified Arthrobacter TaxID=235627 RepID=UPI001D000235|nr:MULTISPECIES: efflux RND transporter periplasmic adaptor subunit [unclassified Arthrobacter]MCB5281102.1 hypothetical protein [Arthrobacter sp. ES1]WGZ80826.1 efflux RND transporter periplasmic adaptor subunit [Arthrobacter sp. EM1]